MGLDTRGNKDTLKKRLRRENAAVKEAASRPVNDSPPRRPGNQDFDSYLCFDVEGTCFPYEKQKNPQNMDHFNYPNEIIEFPMVLLQWDQARYQKEGKWELVIVDEFQSFVKPIWRPILTSFCIELTHIAQADVDAAPTFPEMLKNFEAFMRKHSLFEKGNRTVIVTDGPWDLRDFVSKSCWINGMEKPSYLTRPAIDLRRSFAQYKLGLTKYVEGRAHLPNKSEQDLDFETECLQISKLPDLRIPSVLKALELGEFEGQEHRGIDDARNVSRILRELIRRDWTVRQNMHFSDNYTRYSWMIKLGKVNWVDPSPDDDSASDQEDP